VQRADESTNYANLFRSLAEGAAEPLKSQYLDLAEQWRHLAKERREILEMRSRELLRAQPVSG
jgi:hypothetical protein